VSKTGLITGDSDPVFASLRALREPQRLRVEIGIPIVRKPPQTTTINSIRLHLATKSLPPFRDSQNRSHNPRNIFNDFQTLADHLWIRS
jgi:hypothetical protein